MLPIVIGTRATPLARAQADLIAHRLGELGVAATVRAMSTQGDRSLGGSFAQARGVFTGELTVALRSGSVDIVVHSLKDLPVEDEDDLLIAAVPRRERPSDLLLFATAPGSVEATGPAGAARTLAALLDADGGAAGDRTMSAREAFALLPRGARLGTSSPRRQAGALALRPDLVCCAVRGSVGRRLEWLGSGAIDGLLAAEAGLRRLARSGGLDAPAAAVQGIRLDLRSWPCAPGQGALAVQILRGGRLDGHPALAALDHAPSRMAVCAERALLGRLGGGCLRPFGAWARPGAGDRERPVLRELHALIAPDDWREPAAAGAAPVAVHTSQSTGNGADGVDLDTFAARIEQGLARTKPPTAAGAIAADQHPASDRNRSSMPDLIVTSGSAAGRRLTGRLDPAVRVAALPATVVEVLDTPWPVDRIDLDRPRRRWPWLLVSSPTAARVVVKRAVREPVWGRLPWCALGEGTARALLAAGVPPNLAASAAGGRDFADYAARVLDPRCPLFVPHSARGGRALVEALEAAGSEVAAWAAYTVHPRSDLGWPRAWQAARARVLFTAPSAVSAFAAAGLDWPGSCWAIGAATAAALRSAGAGNVKCAQEPTAGGVERLWLDEIGDHEDQGTAG